MKKHKLEEWIFRLIMFFSTVLIVAVLLLILASITMKAWPALSWEMISQVPHGGYYFGKEGGILNAIVGSLILAFSSTFLALLTGLPVALVLNTSLIKRKRWVYFIRYILDLLWGVPSIVYGALGFSIMIYFGLKTSLLAGIITVSIFILPIMIRAMDEVIKEVPLSLHEASYSLGATTGETAFLVIIRQCFPGVATAVLLSFGRAIGDAASVLFTCGFTDFIPDSLNEPAATLPLAIFFQLGSPLPEVQARAYASAFILTIIVLVISILSRIISGKLNKNKINF